MHSTHDCLWTLNRRAWLGITATGWRDRLRRGRSRQATGPKPVRQGAGGQSWQGDPVPDRLHDPALFSLPTRSGPDRNQSGRLRSCGLGHDAQGGRRSGAGHRRRRASRPGEGTGQEVPRPGPRAADDVLGGLSRGTRRPRRAEARIRQAAAAGMPMCLRSATPRAATANSGSSDSSSSARWHATTV